MSVFKRTPEASPERVFCLGWTLSLPSTGEALPGQLCLPPPPLPYCPPAIWLHTDQACSVPQAGPSSFPVRDHRNRGAWPPVTSLFPRKMFLVGLTGGIASGKSSVIQVFQQLGCAVIDVDVIARHGELGGRVVHSRCPGLPSFHEASPFYKALQALGGGGAFPSALVSCPLLPHPHSSLQLPSPYDQHQGFCALCSPLCFPSYHLVFAATERRTPGFRHHFASGHSESPGWAGGSSE